MDKSDGETVKFIYQVDWILHFVILLLFVTEAAQGSNN